MAGTRRHIEEEVVRYCHGLHERGWVANHDGNLTARLSDGRILSTPTAMSKIDVERQDLLVLSPEGKPLSGRRKAFGELNLHLYVYRERADAGAVVHSHAPHATALAVAGLAVEPRMLPEPVVSLGDRIPLVPYASPKSPESTLNLAPFVHEVDAVTLEHHGVLTWGPDLETAFLRMELVEHLARIQLLAHQMGRVRTVREVDVPALLAARHKAGLGPEARLAAAKPKSDRPVAAETAVVVREEVSRALRQR